MCTMPVGACILHEQWAGTVVGDLNSPGLQSIVRVRAQPSSELQVIKQNINKFNTNIVTQ